ncbi:hypothetical protein [Burkholderia cenocepacia]|uniref:hypothetical protein n=1 Tax=Burkholderia cenocepacia TaxID=95486 RepID=UPI0023B9563B|nr:hypothetical protein [Burkholderia cenocepacia]
MPANDEQRRAKGFLSKIFGPRAQENAISEVEQSDAMTDGLSVSMLLGSAKRGARNRMQIYYKWLEMSGDPIISTALRLHVTAALGGHETSGDVVFIEVAASAKNDAEKVKIAETIAADLSPIFNRIANTIGFNGAAFGDAYGRIYTEGKRGVVEVSSDELVHPTMVTPYERASQTVGFVVASGARATERLSLYQMARMKMPRMVYLPQIRAVEKAIRVSIREDDINKLPLMPSLVGGSFLDGSEGPFDQLTTALVSLTGQRVLDSIDESMITLNQDGMTKQQRDDVMRNIKAILKGSKARAEKAVKSGKPFLERVYHIIPTYGEKQLTALNGSLTNGAGRGQSGTVSIEDVLFYAKLLSGSIGIDLSMLGFAELLSGGLGDGGFFRSSAQSAERSRLLRVGLTDFFNSIIDVHTFHKWGMVYGASERPWHVNFYGTISALESERQRTKTEAMNTTAVFAQTLAQLRDLGLDEKAMHEVLTKIMLLDEEQAALIIKGMARDDEEAEDEGGSGGFRGARGNR